MAKVSLDGKKFVVEVQHHETSLIKQVPGATWNLKEKRWEAPANWASALVLRGTFGDRLELSDAVLKWSQEEWQHQQRVALTRGMSVTGGRYAFQDIGIEFLRMVGSALLGDEMGLGKTRQAILACEDFPVLVVCPNGMKHTWRDEWKKWAPTRSVAVIEGTTAKKSTLLDENFDVYVTNWESLRGLSRLSAFGSIRLSEKEKSPGLLNRPWGTLIADEAHRAKDPHSQQTRALWAVGQTAARRVALTGTPVANSPADLWSIMHFVSPEEWPNKSKYIDRYCLGGANYWGGFDVLGFKAATKEEILSILDTRFLRRTKKEVLPWLPEMTRTTRYIDMLPKQSAAYAKLSKDMLAEVESGILLTTSPMVKTLRLLQIASAYPELDAEGNVSALIAPSNKLSALTEILDEAAGSPIVAFTVSRKLAELLAAKCGVDHVVITGAVGAEERAEAVRRFQTGNVPLAIVTTGAGGEGITLTAASRAVFLQRPWSMVQSLQAEARIHRIGQEAGSVEIIDVVSTGTVEEAVARTLGDKEGLLQEVMRDAERYARFLQGSPLA